MTISHSPADNGRKNSSESSCYAYIYCYFYVFTQLYKSLKFCNLVDNKEDDQFLTNIFIKNNISEQVNYENHNDYKRKKILDTTFDFIEICIKNENNQDVIMKDFFQISLYINI